MLAHSWPQGFLSHSFMSKHRKEKMCQDLFSDVLKCKIEDKKRNLSVVPPGIKYVLLPCRVFLIRNKSAFVAAPYIFGRKVGERKKEEETFILYIVSWFQSFNYLEQISLKSTDHNLILSLDCAQKHLQFDEVSSSNSCDERSVTCITLQVSFAL